jgi:hypothetical protein
MALLSGPLVYVRISTNVLSLKLIDSDRAVRLVAESPFSDKRMLVGNFTNAEALLKQGLKQLRSSWLSLSPGVLMHPLENIDGGLNQIEERVYRELALGAGAHKVVVWSGAELTDAQVTAKLRGSQDSAA